MLSAGLDRRIHAYRIDRGDFTLVNTLVTAAPVLALDIAPNDECMGFGMDKMLCIYRRHPEQHSFAADDKSKRILIGDGKQIVKAQSKVVFHQERGDNRAVQVDITAKHFDQVCFITEDGFL